MRTWQPSGTLTALRQRAAVLAAARDFFSERGVLEVETPVLGHYATTDTFIASMRERQTGFWLRTSPEHHMKRLLADGAPDIYQVGKVFRSGERGAHHEPEFTMAEWYRHDFELDQMIEETCQFISALAESIGAHTGAVDMHDFSELCRRTSGCDPQSATETDWLAAAATHTDFDATLAAQLRDDPAACVDYVVSHIVYPSLPASGLQVVRDYPADQAMLARIHPQRPGIAERFEVFHQGVELANGFRELQDPDEQQQRFVGDNRRRAEAGLPPMAIDEYLLDALRSGLPDCSGVAVGIDRVLMTAGNYSAIDQTLSFPAGN
ncbi:MAG: EF-P lysine aminoacylase GenX [Gammaproteobacteria bacterium]|nr:EF-P lysine aminoacylase GenX [Gammaproteobacteria bacterium]NND53637.1 EF-P lysine aminoacylase GenX [Gammaproteobacteria bacterium]